MSIDPGIIIPIFFEPDKGIDWNIWAQVIVGAIGITIAIAVPAVQRRHETSDRRSSENKHAKALSLLVYPLLIEYIPPMAGNIEKLRREVAKGSDSFNPNLVVWYGFKKVNDAAQESEIGLQHAPEELLDFLYEFGKINQAEAGFQIINKGGDLYYDIKGLNDQYFAYLDNLIFLANRATDKIDELFKSH